MAQEKMNDPTHAAAFNNRLNKQLTGSNIENRIRHWKSFDDHISILEKTIADEEAEIQDCKENIKELKEELEQVKKDKENFTEEKYEASYRFSDTFSEEQPFFCRKAKNKIRAHELQWHRDLIGNFYNDEGYRSFSNAKIPNYEFVGSGSNPLKIKYIYCMDCLKDYYINNKTTSHYMMNLEDDEYGEA